MPFVGRSVTVRSKEECQKSYKFVLDYFLPFAVQNGWKQEYAKTYVSKLLTEAPHVRDFLRGKLAIVTGVTIGGAGYHAAEELALQVGMHVILLGRNETKLRAAMAAITKEAERRNDIDDPSNVTLYETKYDLDQLETAQSAADYVKKLANDKYGGQVHVLLNNAGMICNDPQLTKYGVEANMGRNCITVHYLTELLLPLLKQAAVPGTYKPRVVDVGSIFHIFGKDIHPHLLSQHPKQGGAPAGHIDEKQEEQNNNENDETTTTTTTIDFIKTPQMEGTLCYGRAKLAVITTAMYKQTQHPELNFTCLHPGSIASNFGSALGIVGMIYYYGFYLFQYTPSQGAVSGLRACLDPDFNTENDLQGAYLHADGNPWTVYEPLETVNPETLLPYNLLECGKAIVQAADDIIAKYMSSSSSPVV